MGEVYRAHDSRVNRDVALKILPDGFASDPDRLAFDVRIGQVPPSPRAYHVHAAALAGLRVG